jgi:hypothetical protein
MGFDGTGTVVTVQCDGKTDLDPDPHESALTCLRGSGLKSETTSDSKHRYYHNRY